MAKVFCQCGCGTELAARRDGTYARYAPAGHDAKHKSALVKAAIEGDPAAEAALAERDWTKFLDKKRETLSKQKAKKERAALPVHKRSLDKGLIDPGLFGLSPYQVRLLDNPPNEGTWVCVDPDHQHHGGHGDVACSSKSDICWFCHRERPDDAPMLIEQFNSAIAAMRGLDWKEIEREGTWKNKDDYGRQSFLVASKLLNLRKRHAALIQMEETLAAA